MKVQWHRVTETLPPEGRSLLVWTGTHMLVSDATFYDEEQKAHFTEMANDPRLSEIVIGDIEGYKKHLLTCQGYFQEFGQKYYFEDNKVYWTELPLPPGHSQ